MNNIIQIVTYSAVVVSYGFLAYIIYMLRRQKIKAMLDLVQAKADIDEISMEYMKLSEELNLQKTTSNDGFIKFLSESRNMAFEYIDEVQTAIKEFIIAKEKDNIVEFELAFNKIVRLLPNDSLGDTINKEKK